MFELLTGRQPFSGESAVAIAFFKSEIPSPKDGMKYSAKCRKYYIKGNCERSVSSISICQCDETRY